MVSASLHYTNKASFTRAIIHIHTNIFCYQTHVNIVFGCVSCVYVFIVFECTKRSLRLCECVCSVLSVCIASSESYRYVIIRLYLYNSVINIMGIGRYKSFDHWKLFNRNIPVVFWTFTCFFDIEIESFELCSKYINWKLCFLILAETHSIRRMVCVSHLCFLYPTLSQLMQNVVCLRL